MKTYFSIFCIAISISCFSQVTQLPDSNEPDRGWWQLGVYTSFDLNRDLGIDLFAIDQSRNPNFREGLPFNIRPARTIEANNDSIPFFFTNDRVDSPPLDIKSWYYGGVYAARQYSNGVNIQIGASYGKREYTNGISDPSLLVESTDGFEEFTISEQFGGLDIRMAYHFFSAKKVQPYIGFNVSGYVLSQRLESPVLFRVPAFGYAEEVLMSGKGESTVIDFDMDLHAGILYRITDIWSLGVQLDQLSPGCVGRNGRLSIDLRYWWPK